MSYLILIRHGQSIWNLEKKFTGWVDVDLTENGKSEAKKAGELIKQEKIEINLYYSSFQLRAKNTLKIIQEELQDFKEVKSAWELNERHYGSLTGLNKEETKKKIGEEQFKKYRRSWDKAPPAMERKNEYQALFSPLNTNIPVGMTPLTESLKDTYNRVVPFYENEIKKNLKDKKNVLISAHGNSLRALCKYLFNISDTKINELEIPTGNPLVIEFENNLKVNKYYYLDETRAKDIIFNQ